MLLTVPNLERVNSFSEWLKIFLIFSASSKLILKTFDISLVILKLLRLIDLYILIFY